MNRIKEALKQMSPYEKYKLLLDFLRFIAMLAAPFIAVVIAKMWE